MQRHLKSLLRLADLREEEILIYALLLKNGASSVPFLIEQSLLKSVTVYRTLYRLLDRGLVHAIEINKKQNLFEALPLTSLIKTLQKEQKKLSNLEMALSGMEDYLPYMDVDCASINDEAIEIKCGKESFLEEYLKCPSMAEQDLLTLGNIPNLWRVMGIDYHTAEERNFIKRRMGNGVYARCFNEYDPDMEYIQRNDSRERRTLRFKKNLPDRKNTMLILEKQSLLFICDEENPRVIITKQPELLEMQKRYFQTLWEAA